MMKICSRRDNIDELSWWLPTIHTRQTKCTNFLLLEKVLVTVPLLPSMSKSKMVTPNHRNVKSYRVFPIVGSYIIFFSKFLNSVYGNILVEVYKYKSLLLLTNWNFPNFMCLPKINIRCARNK